MKSYSKCWSVTDPSVITFHFQNIPIRWHTGLVLLAEVIRTFSYWISAARQSRSTAMHPST